MKLNVFLFNTLAGYLFSTADRGVVFAYDEDYINNNGMPLSLSLPLQKEEFSQKKCMPYFSGLLPEGMIRNRISEYLHISESSTIKFLQALGGECSGTVSFYNSEDEINSPKQNWEFSEENYIPFSNENLYTLIKESKNKPMLLGSKDLRLSLAGAQEKISLAYFNDTWHLPKNGAPSTHILKPTRSGELSTMAQNEFFCMNLAEKLNLPVPTTQILEMEDLSVFVCQRYDRKFDSEKGTIQRIHQEDFCQALGIMNDIKYQADGGPSFKDCFNLIQEKFSDKLEQINIFLKSILFNYLIGNCDSHGKNFSLMFEDSKIKLSPLYDLVSTTVYPSLTTKMAMKLGSNYEIEKITRNDFFKQAEIFDIKNRYWLNTIEDFSKNLMTAFTEVSNMPEFSKCEDLIELLHKQINSRLTVLTS